MQCYCARKICFIKHIKEMRTFFFFIIKLKIIACVLMDYSKYYYQVNRDRSIKSNAGERK